MTTLFLFLHLHLIARFLPCMNKHLSELPWHTVASLKRKETRNFQELLITYPAVG